MNRGSNIRRWIGYLIIVAGLCVLASPFITGYLDNMHQRQAVQDFIRDHLRPSEDTGNNNEKEKNGKEPEDISDPFYQAALAYNQNLFETSQSLLTSTQATEQFPLDPKDYGYEDGAIGTMWIPRMQVELGIYLGANSDNMAKGAAIFGQTSIPLGQKNENAAIAGHRGWKGTPMFRDIQSLQMSDAIYLTTDWGTLLYRVCDIVIVTPDDNSWCQIHEGQTLITLMTCHPYTQHYQRYIVFASLEQIFEKDYLLKERNRQATLTKASDTKDDSPRIATEYEKDGSSRTVEIDPAAIRPDGTEYGAIWSNFVILAEKQIFRITIVLTLIVVLLGIWLLITTIRNRRNSDE